MKVVYELSPESDVQGLGLNCGSVDQDLFWPPSFMPATATQLSKLDLLVVDPHLERADFMALGALFCARQSLCTRMCLHESEDVALTPIAITSETDPYFALVIRRYLRMEEVVYLDRCIYDVFPDGSRDALPRQWIFRSEALTTSMLFQLEGVRTYTFCAHVEPDHRTDFYTQYMRRELSGIRFQKLWQME